MAKPQKTALDLIRDHHGSGAVFGGNENVRYAVSATSTGSLNLDTAIGCGGIPDGRVILWSGPESSGKTLGSLCFAKKKQQEGKRVLYIDAECTWDHNWAASLGLKVAPEWTMVAQESSGIKIFDLLSGKPKSEKPNGRKTAVPGILSEEILKQMELEGTPLGLIILDSINMVQPPLEQDMQTGDQQIGSLSRFLPPVLRRLTPLLKKFNVPMVVICQARTNIGQMKGDPLTVSGGKALMHAASLWMDSRKVGGTEIFATTDTNEEKPIGHVVRIKIRKNKVGPPARKAELTIYYTKGIDLRPELLDQGLERGLIRQEGNTLTYSGFSSGRVVGKNNAMAAIFGDKKLAQRLLVDITSHKANADREFKKSGSEFVEEGEENVVDGVVSTKFQGTDDSAKVIQSSQAVSKVTVRPDGTKIDNETGEVVRPSLKVDEDPLAEEDPTVDPEVDIAVVTGENDDDILADTPPSVGTPPVAEVGTGVTPPAPTPSSSSEAAAVASTSGSDIDTMSFADLKNLAKTSNIKGWYKLGSTELREVLKQQKK
jgi:recombination protein RecA